MVAATQTTLSEKFIIECCQTIFKNWIFMDQGFVLKNFYPHKQKLLLLDREHGAIEVVIQKQLNPKKFSIGALLNYHLEERQPLSWANNINIIDMPFAWAREDILFLHHLLEIIQHFAPLEQPQPHLYALLAGLYSNPVRSSAIFKKQLLAQLFLMLGLPSVESPAPHTLSTAELDIWLIRCVQEHPYHELFKTVHFLAPDQPS